MTSSLRLNVTFVAVMLATQFAVTAAAQSPADPDPRIFLEKARASMAVITNENESGQPISTGAGFFVGKHLIATDLGVVISARRIRVQPAGQEQKADASTYNNNRLVTILAAAGADGPSLTLGDSEKLSVNEKIFLLGYTNHEVSMSEGIITKLGTSNDPRCFQISPPITSSSRGGPVLNSKGEVIGIAGEIPNAPGQGMVMPVSYLTALLKYVTGPGMGTGVGVGSGGGVGPGLPSTGPGRGDFGGDSSPTAPSTSVDVRPVLLNNPTPHYTEEARRNQVQGAVTLRVLVGDDGQVKKVSILRGLPDGLDEQAIATARQLKFRPAMKDGHAVTFWVVLQMEFKLR